MLTVTKHVLARLDEVYAVTMISIGGQSHILAASEGHGECLLLRPPDWRSSVVWEKPGGCMCMAPVPATEGEFVAIQRAFPVFCFEDAGLVHVVPAADVRAPWDVRPLADLPFAHRAIVVGIGCTSFVVAATLCAGKASRDDWSKPGQVLVGRLSRSGDGPLLLRPVLEGITKNHGMHQTSLDGKAVVLVSGEEGVFQLTIPSDPDGAWEIKRLLESGVSDLFVGDIDGDGESEMAAIQPFHGDSLAIYKQRRGKWELRQLLPLDSGHVVWIGSIQQAPGVIVGNRASRKDLSLLRFRSRDLSLSEKVTLEEGAAPSQIVVIPQDDRDWIVSANSGKGEVALYEITSSS